MKRAPTDRESVEALADDCQLAMLLAGPNAVKLYGASADTLHALLDERDEGINQLDSVKHSLSVLEGRALALLAERDKLRAWIAAEAEARGDADADYPPERQCATALKEIGHG